MGSKTVLLVEDDLEIRDILQDVLEADGFDVVPASNGKQALDFLILNRPQKADSVILDLMMPMVSGLAGHGTYDRRSGAVPESRSWC